MCEGHWFDKADDRDFVSIMDKFHIPAVDDHDDTGICVRCRGRISGDDRIYHPHKED